MDKDDGGSKGNDTQNESRSGEEQGEAERSDHGQQETSNTHKDGFWSSWTVLERTQIVFNGLLTVFTILYAVVTVCQLRIMSQTQQLDFRVLLAPHSLEVDTLAENQKIQVSLVLENKGRLPAREVTARAKIIVVTAIPAEIKLTDPLGLSQQKSFCYVGTLIEGISATCVFAGDDPIPPETFTAITEHHQTFVVFTDIEYRDELLKSSEPPHTSSRCEVYIPGSHKFARCPPPLRSD